MSNYESSDQIQGISNGDKNANVMKEKTKKRRNTIAGGKAMQRLSVPEENRCNYPTKNCPNPRTFKPNGERHHLCEFHRIRQNSTQR